MEDAGISETLLVELDPSLDRDCLCSEEQSSQKGPCTRVKKPWEGIMWRSDLSLLEQEEVQGDDDDYSNGPLGLMEKEK